MFAQQCPKCSAKLRLGDHPQVGQVLICENCSAEIEILWLFPLELGLVGPPSIRKKKEKNPS